MTKKKLADNRQSRTQKKKRGRAQNIKRKEEKDLKITLKTVNVGN